MDRNGKERLDRFVVALNGRLVRRSLTVEQAIALGQVIGGTVLTIEQWIDQVVGPQRHTNAA